MGAFDAVLFDFGHTLFDSIAPEACLAQFRDASGVDVDPVAFASASATIRHRARQPDELAKGRDLSAEAHERCWLELFAPLDGLASGLAEFVYGCESLAEGLAAVSRYGRRARGTSPARDTDRCRERLRLGHSRGLRGSRLAGARELVRPLVRARRLQTRSPALRVGLCTARRRAREDADGRRQLAHRRRRCGHRDHRADPSGSGPDRVSRTRFRYAS